jgi:hypothetical protein
VWNKDDGTVCCIVVDGSEKFWQYMVCTLCSVYNENKRKESE